MRFEPEGVTQNPEIPFAKSMPDYIMRWLASRFLDADAQEELGILTPQVRARRAAQETARSVLASDTAEPSAGNGADGPEGSPRRSDDDEDDDPQPNATKGEAGAHPVADASASTPAASTFTDSPPVIPARLRGLDLGPACSQCGGMMQRTGSCYTCSSCGHNTGCG
jgi:ribonucleoside-diphosphate reductase alpha chain